jgi:hypothetical protein
MKSVLALQRKWNCKVLLTLYEDKASIYQLFTIQLSFIHMRKNTSTHSLQPSSCVELHLFSETHAEFNLDLMKVSLYL